MKPLLLSTSDIDGGAARSAYRLHQGLQTLGVASEMLVQLQSSDDPTVHSPRPNFPRDLAKLRAAFDFLPLKFYQQRQGLPFSCQWLPDGVYNRVSAIKPDILNLHWVGGGFLQIETLAKFQQPIVFTLHDMWAFTGGCHYSQACDRYTQSCGACPQLGSKPEWDLSRWIWQRKSNAWRGKQPIVVTPSKWLAECAANSRLFHHLRIETIPYGIDLTRFRPLDRATARHLLNLPQDRYLILSGAANYRHDRRKGLHLLQAALQSLSQTGWGEQLAIVLYGASQPKPQENTLDFQVETHYLGTLKDDISLALAYSAADVFVAPSVQDNLPNTVMEAIACGLPNVAFNIGGMPDLITHQTTGYLAQPFDVKDFAEGITWVLADPERRQTLANAARESAEQKFRLELQAQRYIDLFEELLSCPQASN